MIDCDETTLWENSAKPGSDEPGSGTYNHAWSRGPLTMMHQYIAGVEPSEPGFRRFTVKPQLGPLRHVETAVPTPYGDIHQTVDRLDDDTFAMELVVPDGTTAEVTLDGCSKTLKNGSHRWNVVRRVSP